MKWSYGIVKKLSDRYQQAADGLKSGRTMDEIRNELVAQQIPPKRIGKILGYAQWSLDPANGRSQRLYRFLVIAPLVLWIIGLFFPGFISTTNPANEVMGAQCFLSGLMLFWSLFIFTGAIIAWYANVFFFVVIAKLLFTRMINELTLLIFMIAGCGLSLVVLLVHDISTIGLGAEVDLKQVKLGIGGYLWLAAIAVLLFEVFVITIRKGMYEQKLKKSLAAQ